MYHQWGEEDQLLLAASTGDLATVKRLVAKGTPVDLASGDGQGWVAAHAAAEMGHLQVLKFLVSKDADLTRTTASPEGFNVVHLASRGGHLAVLEWFDAYLPGVRPLYFMRDGRGRIPADSSANGEVKRFFRRIGADHVIGAGAGGGGGKQQHGGEGGGGGQKQGRKGGRRRQHKGAAEKGEIGSAGGGDGDGDGDQEQADSFATKSSSAAKPKTIFRAETEEEVQRGKMDATRPLQYRYRHLPYTLHCPRQLSDPNGGSHLPMPLRPAWHRGMSGEELRAREDKAFSLWLKRLYQDHKPEALNHFEHNVDVWRQLWRVIERSQVLLLLVDSRCPGLHFHRSLYEHITRDAHKGVIVCLTKADLVPPQQQLEAWTQYLHETYDPDLLIVPFASATSRSALIEGGKESVAALMEAIKTCLAKDGGFPLHLLDMEREQGRRGQEEDEDEREEEFDDDNDEEEQEEESEEDEEEEEGEEETTTTSTSKATEPSRPWDELLEAGTHGHGDDRDDDRGGPKAGEDGRLVVTVGLIGDPNMGKSSLLNTIFGRKKVSVSATPGHTKHLQTHFYSKGLIFCDCPGVVFPRAFVERPLQVLMGSYPIAQVREPVTAIRYLAERCDPPLHVHYKLKFPSESAAIYAEGTDQRAGGGDTGSDGPDTTKDGDFGREEQWSPYLLAEAYARQQGFFSKGRGGRPDVSRAANKMLRDALVGRSVSLIFFPPPAQSDPTSSIA